jgi:hypothetical protein
MGWGLREERLECRYSNISKPRKGRKKERKKEHTIIIMVMMGE